MKSILMQLDAHSHQDGYFINAHIDKEDGGHEVKRYMKMLCTKLANTKRNNITINSVLEARADNSR